MDQNVSMVVTRPLPAVFASLADPTRLNTWLTPLGAPDDDVSGHETSSASLDAAFVVHLDGHDAVGEVIAHEPPRYVAYRVTMRSSTHVLRIICEVDSQGATRVLVHQSGAEQLAIDLSALDDLVRG